MSYYQLALETGDALSDEGAPVVWAACPDLPGAYEEAPTSAEARERLLALARHILAEHLMREDPLDPAITTIETLPTTDPGDALIVPITEADIAAARAAPMLVIEVPEP
jgi:hypothetical protein